MMHAKAITLRKLPPEVARRVRRRAAEKGLSLNRAVIEILEEALGIGGKGRVPAAHADLDALIGSWSREEARLFDASLDRQRAIDPDLWK